ncbi:hypothetical protein HYDPIDRAFT_80212 [Hydnomerulius pinastri MD-312]|nr:hypothetical protein HYDPIDRAFT_80212 [Hydnomerulius pinastri MD-312]
MIPEIRQHIRDLAHPLARKYGLTVFPEFADITVLAWLFFSVVHISLSPAVSRAIFPISYGKANKKTRKNWDAHVVSLVHALVVVVLASRCLNEKSLVEDRAFGVHRNAGFVCAIAIGYFIWDAIESIVHFTDIGFVIHGVACLTIFVLGSRPFVQYYSMRFLLWEVSTIFLDLHWFLDKTGKTGTTLQLVNGVALLGAFFSVRLIWGGKMSYDFFITLNGVYEHLPLVYIVVYGAANIMLQGLNWFWFTKMISALRKRFTSKPVNGKSNGHGILNGHGNGNGKLDHDHLD